MRKALSRLAVPVTFLGLLLLCVGCGKPAPRERRPGTRVPGTGVVEEPLEKAGMELPATEESGAEEEPAAEPEPEEVEEEPDGEEDIEEAPVVKEEPEDPQTDW